MATKIPNIEFPELVFGFVGAIGVDLNPTIATFETFFKSHDYNVVPIRVTDLYEVLQKAVPPRITVTPH